LVNLEGISCPSEHASIPTVLEYCTLLLVSSKRYNALDELTLSNSPLEDGSHFKIFPSLTIPHKYQELIQTLKCL